MAFSRSARITLLLVIDILFFFIELIVGYSVGSLALVADSFHMLNDVMSLVVALYAIKLTSSSAVNPQYSYGWHRAEILAALVNGVFLLALCFSIFLDAIERFFTTPHVSNPTLVVIVGSFGLASNILGLFLFHEHGHAHEHTRSKPPSVIAPSRPESVNEGETPVRKGPSRVRSRSRSPSQEYLYGHPAATRVSLVQTATEMARERSPSQTHPNGPSRPSGDAEHRPQAPRANRFTEAPVAVSETSDEGTTEGTPLLQGERDQEARARARKGQGHAHAGSMNMRALVLHVMGDALGNIGVVSTGLIIWLTDWWFKYYFDPAISLVITAIIFSSALPLVKSASFILLQGVPSTVSLEAVRNAILQVEGVLSLHELHVWQLSETKVIASVHILTSREHDFMPTAVKIREALHHHGIHSSTIQPEYLYPGINLPEEQLKSNAESPCLVLCPPDQACDPAENACCPPPPMEV
ncbi:putative cation efflux protein [Lyophyllum shimeji]|uniref:Cation efflux protein n=1 Tax=Lyophyllum shimeji TaxID=47721 RepID=A0A9P3UMD8_LYOSH|nr:putative cation efflux protein [Lyophyllum shimeji]